MNMLPGEWIHIPMQFFFFYKPTKWNCLVFAKFYSMHLLYLLISCVSFSEEPLCCLNEEQSHCHFFQPFYTLHVTLRFLFLSNQSNTKIIWRASNMGFSALWWWQFFSTNEQPAEALRTSTIFITFLDDPSTLEINITVGIYFLNYV